MATAANAAGAAADRRQARQHFIGPNCGRGWEYPGSGLACTGVLRGERFLRRGIAWHCLLVSLLVLALGVFFCALSFVRGKRVGRVTGVLGLVLCLTPFPVYLYTIQVLCYSYSYCITE